MNESSGRRRGRLETLIYVPMILQKSDHVSSQARDRIHRAFGHTRPSGPDPLVSCET